MLAPHHATGLRFTWRRGDNQRRPALTQDVVCVALGCLSPNRQPLGGEIWNDRGGGAPRDAAFFEQPGGTGLFRCSDDATHNKPHGEFPLPGQASIGLPRTQPVRPQPLDETATESNKRPAIIAFVIGIIMFGIGLPLFIGGNVGSGEEALGMVIPGAILFSVGAVVAGVASFVLISSWSKSYAESRKAPPKWPKIATVCAALLLIPGASLLIIGLVSSGTIHHEDTASAFLRISDADGLGDQGFIIFIEGTPGDFDSNGIHDYCEAVVVSAHHSGSWMSDPWTATAKWNEADATRQAFELEIAHPGSGCSADVWPEQKGGNLVKIGRACYGCMAGYTDISAYSNDFSYEIPMWIQDGEKVVESTGTWIAGSIMLGISVLSLVGLGIIRSSLRESMAARKDPETPAIEVLAATEGKSVRFRINDPPSGRSAWVGIYPSGAADQDHGEEGERWKWLRDMDPNRASFPEKSEGRWSIRVFSDGGFNLDRRVDFDILPEKERWWED